MKQIEFNGEVFKVGDTVRIERKIDDNAEDGMGPLGYWDNVWVPSMTAMIGKTAVISGIHKTGVHFQNHKFGYPLTAFSKALKNPVTNYELKPFMRVVTRNGWQWIVSVNDLLLESRPTNLFIVREAPSWTYVQWKGQDVANADLDVVEVWDHPPLAMDALNILKRGKLLWTETMEKEQAEKAELVSRLKEQRNDIDSRIAGLEGA